MRTALVLVAALISLAAPLRAELPPDPPGVSVCRAYPAPYRVLG